MEPSLDLCLSQYDSLPIHSDKKEICENAYVKPMNPHAICVLEPNICVESRHVVHIAGDKYELKLLSSLKTLGYIEFDDLCNLSDLMLICHRFLKIHIMFFGKYNNKDQYMMQRVYICTNLNFSFVEQHRDQLGDYEINMPTSSSFALQKQLKSKEGEHMFLVSTILLQDGIDKDRVSYDRGAYKFADI